MLSTLYRNIFLTIANLRFVKTFIMTYGMRLGADRFVAAETLEETIEKIKALNQRGFAATLDFLGEYVTKRKLAEQCTAMILQILDEIERHQLNCNVSVKLTQLGLLIDEDFCLKQLERILEKAKQVQNFIRIDMEDHTVTDSTLRIFIHLLQRFGKDHVGIAIQSYLYRSSQDMERLSQLQANVRVVKGAYHEPKEVVYPRKKDVDSQYVRIIQRHLLSRCYTAIATHDQKIIEQLKPFLDLHYISPAKVEFQMLYGIAGDLQLQLLKEGYKVRIYTPFGKHWYAYFSRRIAERPANLFFILKNLFRK